MLSLNTNKHATEKRGQVEKKLKLNHGQLAEVWQTLDRKEDFFNAEKSGQPTNDSDTTIALLVADQYGIHGNWKKAAVDVKCLFHRRKFMAPGRRIDFDKIGAYCSVLAKLGAFAFGAICLELSPQYAAALYLAVKRQQNCSFEHALAELKANNPEWVLD